MDDPTIVSNLNREAWLKKAVDSLAPLFEVAGWSVPPVRVSCSWPSSCGRPGKKTRLGECWACDVAEDKLNQIFITPLYSDSVDVLGVLVHELSHAAVGVNKKHRGPFVKCIRALGLEGKPTATTTGEKLKGELQKVVKKIGPYPHSKLVLQPQQKKETTRLLKAKCETCECVFRITKKWVQESEDGLVCPISGCNGGVEVTENESRSKDDDD